MSPPTPEALKAAISRPIVSLPTFFYHDGTHDLKSLQSTVAFCLDNGLTTLLLTAGDSNYELQSEQEIRTVTRTVVDAAANSTASSTTDATVLVGTSLHWWQGQILDFVDFVEGLGAAAMVCRPAPSLVGADDLVYDLYAAAAERAGAGIVLNGRFSMSLLDRLADHESIVGLKEDAGDAWCHDALYTVGDRLTVFNGGQKWRFLYGRLWGMAGYMTSFGPWAPRVTHAFWSAVQADDSKTAAQIVDDYDNPFFAHTIGHARGFHPARQAAFEIFGRGPRWLRRPQASLTDDEVEALREVFVGMGLEAEMTG